MPPFLQDDAFWQRHAPRRDKRGFGIPSREELKELSESLDWDHNDLEFYALCQGLYRCLDRDLRWKRGRRLEQLATFEELYPVWKMAGREFSDPDLRPQIVFVLECFLAMHLASPE